MSDCIFCMIADGKMSAKVVYEDDEIIAFDDIMPQAPIHTLVVPKEHYDSLSDGVPEELLGRLMAKVPEIAETKGISETGYRVIINTGRDAAQSVGHLHVHVLGGRMMSHGMVNFDNED
ncbi:MAG: histidine triad nucleotide-binding protein [Coriobacteriia bacterium]